MGLEVKDGSSLVDGRLTSCSLCFIECHSLHAKVVAQVKKPCRHKLLLFASRASQYTGSSYTCGQW